MLSRHFITSFWYRVVCYMKCGDTMKKCIVLGMVLFLGVFNTVSGKDFNGPRWQTVFSDETETLKLDVNTVSYDVTTDMAEAWVVRSNVEPPYQEVVYYKLYFYTNEIRVVEALLYKPESNGVVGRRNLDYYVNADASEGIESVWNTVKRLTDRDTKKAAYDKKEREEMWANWKQRWEEDERRRQEGVNSPILTIKRTVES